MLTNTTNITTNTTTNVKTTSTATITSTIIIPSTTATTTVAAAVGHGGVHDPDCHGSFPQERHGAPQTGLPARLLHSVAWSRAHTPTRGR